MADYVRARITAAKVGVGLAITGVMAGVVERVRPQQPEDPMALSAAGSDAAGVHSAAATGLGQLKNKISSGQIKDHSLLYKDFKTGQVLPYTQLKTIKSLSKKAAALESSFNQFKIDIGSALASVYSKTQANSAFLSKSGTAANASKLGGLASSDFVNGHGSVFSGVQHFGSPDDPKTVLTVPGIITVKGDYSDGLTPFVQIANLTGSAITITWIDSNGTQGAVIEGTPAELQLGSSNRILTAQLLTSDGRPVTLTASFVPDDLDGDPGKLVVQALATPAP